MSAGRRPVLYTALAVVGLIGLGVVLRPSGAHATPEPTDADLGEFLGLAPSAFGPLIATREAETPVIMHPVPFAVGLADGTAVRIVAPRATPDLDSDSDLGSADRDGLYAPPKVLRGQAIDRIAARKGDSRRSLRLVVTGSSGPRAIPKSYHSGIVFSTGTSTKHDLGPIVPGNGRYPVPSWGASHEGFTLVTSERASLRKVALAPEELDPTVRGEAGGYALLYDEMSLLRSRGPNSSRTYTLPSGPALPPPFQRLWTKTIEVSGQDETFSVTGLVHVYRRQSGRWRYSRSWSLIGDATTTFATDELAFAQGRRSANLGSVSFGVPKILVARAANPLVR